MVERYSTTSAAEKESTLQELQAELADARLVWAGLSSKRQRRTGDYKGLRAIHGYNAAKLRYDQLSIAYAKKELAETLANTNDETQRKLIVAEHYLHEQNTLREASKQTTEGKRTWRFANKFSKWMNEGTRGQRIAKGLGVGMAIGVFGGIVGATAGTVVVGTGIATAARFGKGYLMRHSEGIGRTSVSAQDMAASLNDNGELIDQMHALSSDIYENDSKHEQRKIKTAVKWGFGTVAMGAVLGHTLNGLAGLAPAHAEVLPDVDHTSIGVDPQHDIIGVDTGSEHGIIGVETAQHEQLGISNESHGLAGLDDSSGYDIFGVDQPEVGHEGVGLELDSPHSPVAIEATTESDAVASADNHMPIPVEPQHDVIGAEASESSSDHEVIGIDGDGDTASHDGVPLDEGGIDSDIDGADHDIIGLDDGGAEPAPDSNLHVGDTFTVEAGSSYTNELIDAAAENGVEMTKEQAWLAHQAIVDQLGTSDYINLADHHGPDTYAMGDTPYEVGISAPSEAASWSADAQPLIADATDDGVVNGSVVSDMHETIPLDQGPTLSESDWNGIDTMLQDAATSNAIEDIGPNGQAFLNELGPELRGMVYADGTKIMGFDGKNWHFNDSISLMPQRAIDAIHTYLMTDDTALENAQKFAEVIQ